MKIGLISDIHADLRSLESALTLLQKRDVEKVVCMGDLVERGFEGDGVVSLIRDQTISCVMGNHDRDVIANQAWLLRNIDVNHPEAKKRLLTEATLAFLRQLPDQVRWSWEWMRLLAAHGTPRSKDEYLFSLSPSIKFKMIAEEAEADVIFLGHTHEPMQVRCRGVWFFNPGSVYAEEGRGSHTCATLTLPDYQFEVFEISTGAALDVPVVRLT